MKESSTYRAILEEARAEGRREGRAEVVHSVKEVIRRVAEDAFGPPDAQTVAAFDQVDDLQRLVVLIRRLRPAMSWRELLGPLLPTSQAAAALTLRPKVRAGRRRALLCRRWTPVRRRA
jgi:hypothetical protein